MIVYASLLPFSSWMAPIPGTPFFLFAPWPPRYTRFDIAINVVAYAAVRPGGRADRRAAPRAKIRIARAAAVGALLSLCMESAQMFVPTRDASAIDLISNTAGAALGGALAAAYCAVIPALRAKTGAWRRRVFLEGRGGDLGLALLGIWMLAQVNPGHTAVRRDLRSVAGTHQRRRRHASAGSAKRVQRRSASACSWRCWCGSGATCGGAVLLLIGVALMLKGFAATLLLRQAMMETWLKPGVLARHRDVARSCCWWRSGCRARCARRMCAIALLSSLVAPLLAPDMWQARAPIALFDWPYGQLLNFNGLTHAVLVVWPVLASVLSALARRAAGLGSYHDGR